MKSVLSSISFDKESGVLSFQLKKKQSVDSDISGNVVVDYDKKGEIVRINFYNFSFDDFKSIRKKVKELTFAT